MVGEGSLGVVDRCLTFAEGGMYRATSSVHAPNFSSSRTCSTVASTFSVISSRTPFMHSTATMASTTNGMTELQPSAKPSRQEDGWIDSPPRQIERPRVHPRTRRHGRRQTLLGDARDARQALPTLHGGQERRDGRAGQTRTHGGGADSAGEIGRQPAVDDGVEDGGAEGTADGARAEAQPRRRAEVGVRRGELDEGDEEGEGAGLPDAREDVDGVLRAGPGGGRADDGVEDDDEEEEGVGGDEGGFEVFEFGGVEAVGSSGEGDGGWWDCVMVVGLHDRDAHEQARDLVGELPDADVPRVALEAQAEHDLRRDAVDGGVEDPAFDGEGERGQGEVRRALEEDVRDDAVRAALPLVQAEADEEDEADDERRHDVDVAPAVRAARPVEREQQERGRADEQDGADGVDLPQDLLEGEAGVVRVPLRVVEDEQAEGGGEVEGCLHPEDVALEVVSIDTESSDGRGWFSPNRKDWHSSSPPRPTPRRGRRRPRR